MFDFPDVPRQIYDRNFLRSAIFNIEFSEKIDWESHSESIFYALKDHFPIKNNSLSVNIVKNVKEEISLSTDTSSFELKSIDNLSILAFQNNILAIVLHGKRYSSFDSFKHIFSIVNDTILRTELSKYKIKKISERKINLIDFQNNGNSGLSLLKQLINTQLVGNIDYIPNINLVKQSINSIVFENENGTLDIKYGYNKINNEIGQIILDMVLFTNTLESNIENFESINTELFKAFNWAITEEYKHLMKNEQ